MGKQVRQFFFEKKHPKNFCALSPASPRQPGKSFCFSFQEKRFLPGAA
jgi:hypothetical protein